MPTPPLTREDAKATIAEVERAAQTVVTRTGRMPGGHTLINREAGRVLGLGEETVRTRLRRAWSLYGLAPDFSKIKMPPTPAERGDAPVTAPQPPPPPGPEEVAEQARDRQRRELEAAQERAKTLETALADLRQDLHDALDFREAAFGLSKTPLAPPSWQIRSGTKQHRAEIPVLFTSDFQYGEVVSPDEIDYVNEYNPQIAQRRYRALIEKTCQLADIQARGTGSAPPGIIVLRGGDAISGSIHDELAITDAMVPAAQVIELASLELWGLSALIEHFGQVTVYSVPGNHGRTTRKPSAKNYVAASYENLATDRLAMAFAERYRDTAPAKRPIRFITPQSGDAYFSIYDTRFLLTHGDRIGSRGGTGFIGPAATVLRGVHKTRQQYAQLGRPVDRVCMGHFHVPMFVPHCIVNGALIGFNEYARDLRVTPEPPSQWLFWVHPTHAITTYREVIVDALGAYREAA